MQQIPYASSWRKFSLRLTALVLVAVVGGWAMSAVLAPKPASTVGARAPVEAAAVMSPMEFMIRFGRGLPETEYVEPF